MNKVTFASIAFLSLQDGEHLSKDKGGHRPRNQGRSRKHKYRATNGMGIFFLHSWQFKLFIIIFNFELLPFLLTVTFFQAMEVLHILMLRNHQSRLLDQECLTEHVASQLDEVDLLSQLQISKRFGAEHKGLYLTVFCLLL